MRANCSRVPVKRSSKLNGPGGLSSRQTRRSRALMQKSVPLGITSTAVNSWMPSMPLDRRASSCWNHRFGSDGSTDSCCSGCGDTEKLRCGVPTYFAESSEMMFSTRVVWLISSRRSSDACAIHRVDGPATPRGRWRRRWTCSGPTRRARAGQHRIGELVSPADALEVRRARVAAQRLVDLRAALADRDPVGLALVGVRADDSGLHHAAGKRRGGVEVRPDRAKISPPRCGPSGRAAGACRECPRRGSSPRLGRARAETPPARSRP